MNITQILFSVYKTLSKKDSNLLLNLFECIQYYKCDLENYFYSNELKYMYKLLDSNLEEYNSNFKYGVELICKMHNINYFTLINDIRELIGEPINDGYLFYLLDSLDTDLIKQNDYLTSIFNLLSDRNYNINNIGTKINVTKYLKSIDLKDLNILKVKNAYLSDAFSFLSFKNDKTKLEPNKIIFKDNLIIINSLDSDRIFSVVLYHYTNENIHNIMNNYINENINTFNIKDVQINKYTVVDTEFKTLQFICDLINVLKLFKNDYNELELNISDINEFNAYEYIQILNENYQIFYRFDKLQYKYEYILEYFKQLDNFQCNDIELIKTDINSYCNFNYSFKEQKTFDIDLSYKIDIKFRNEKIKKLILND